MGLMASEKSGSDFPSCPAGTHVARCRWVVDIGTQEGQFGAKHQCIIGWELPHCLIVDGERKGEPYFLSTYYTMSLHEKANLRQDLEAWRGQDFTEEELDGFDLKTIAGVPCLLSVIHKEKKAGGKAARVGGVMALPSGTVCPDAVNPEIIWDFDKPDDNALDALPEWVQKKIKEAPEWGCDPNDPKEHTPPPADGDDIPF